MKFFKTEEDPKNEIPIPTRGSIASAGYDLASQEDYILYSGRRHMFETKIGIQMRAGEAGKIEPRSKLANKYGIMVLAGRVDSDYRGELRVILYNSGDSALEICKGDRIAQLVVQDVIQSKPVFIANPTETVRGSAGIEDDDLRL